MNRQREMFARHLLVEGGVKMGIFRGDFDVIYLRVVLVLWGGVRGIASRMFNKTNDKANLSGS